MRRNKQIHNKDRVIAYLYGTIWWVAPFLKGLKGNKAKNF